MFVLLGVLGYVVAAVLTFAVFYMVAEEHGVPESPTERKVVCVIVAALAPLSWIMVITFAIHEWWIERGERKAYEEAADTEK